MATLKTHLSSDFVELSESPRSCNRFDNEMCSKVKTRLDVSERDIDRDSNIIWKLQSSEFNNAADLALKVTPTLNSKGRRSEVAIGVGVATE